MSNKQKILLAGAVIVLLIAGFSWNFLVAKAANIAQAKIVAKVNDNINGKLSIGAVDISLLGTVTAANVTVYDDHGVVIGKSDKISVEYGLSDLLSGNVDFQSLKTITLENPVILMVEQDGVLNWENLPKAKKDQPFTFRGQVNIKQGIVNVGTPDNRKLQAVDGKVDFAKYPALSFDLTGKTNTTPVSIKGAWNFDGDGNLVIKADQIPLTDLPLDLLAQSELQITGGVANNLVVGVVQQANKLSLSGEGTVNKFAGSVAGYTLTEGAGKIKLIDGKLNLQETSLLLNNQKVTLDGAMSLAAPDYDLNLNAAAAGFDPAVLAGGSFAGPITFQANITGSAARPLTTGQFSIPRGALGSLSFTNASGGFVYTAGTLTLDGAKANAWDGTLFIAGNVLPTSQEYALTVNGRGVDSALLSDKDITGRVDFDARVTGQGTARQNADGSFRMGEGSFSGIPFLGMTGDFTKQGDQMNFYNIVVRTIGGSFSAAGLSEGSIVRLRKIDVPITNPRELVNNAISNQINKAIPDQLKKLF